MVFDSECGLTNVKLLMVNNVPCQYYDTISYCCFVVLFALIDVLADWEDTMIETNRSLLLQIRQSWWER